MIEAGHSRLGAVIVRVRQIIRVRRSLARTLSANNGRPEKSNKSADDVAAFRRLGADAVRHRLSWFATVQGLLFLSFALIDKSAVTLISLLVCVAVAMCLPAIASAYTSPRLKNWMRLLLAVLWVALGVAQFVLRPT